MRYKRLIWFGLSILLGVILGLFYGWRVTPLEFREAAPAALRADYQTDYALMVAEVFQQEKDVTLAARRLAVMEIPPARTVQKAILSAQDLGYARSDLETLARLFQELQTWVAGP